MSGSVRMNEVERKEALRKTVVLTTSSHCTDIMMISLVGCSMANECCGVDSTISNLDRVLIREQFNDNLL